MRKSILPLFVLICLSVMCTGLLAQDGVRQFMKVTPEGTEIITEYGPPISGSPTVPGRNTSAGLRWNYPHPPAQPWISNTVSVGDRGTQAFVGQHLNYERAQLFSVTDGNPPTPIWEDTALESPQTVYMADSSQTGDFHVLLYRSTDATQVYVNCYRTGSSTPIWTWTPPFTGTVGSAKVAIDRAPTVVAIGAVEYDADPLIDDIIHLYFLDPATGALTGSYDKVRPHNKGLRGWDLSANGKRLLYHSSTDCYILDIPTLTEEHTSYIGQSFDSHCISGDGDKYAYGKFYNVVIWEKIGGIWTSYNHGTGSSTFAGHMDFSDDGSTLGFSVVHYTAYHNYDIHMMDIATKTITASRSNVHSGTKESASSGAAISHDGRYFAHSSWGDEFNENPEVQILENGVGLIGSIDTRGSALDVDISWDGQVTVSSGKAVHATTFGKGGDVDCYDLGDEDMEFIGAPKIGQNITINVYTNPNWKFMLWLGSKDVPTGFLTLFPEGTLYLDISPPNVWIMQPIMLANGSGVGSLTGMIPPDPATIGFTVFLQSIFFTAPPAFEFSDDYLTVTLMP